MQSTAPTVNEMMDMSEAELEALVMARGGNDDARYVLGRLMLEGTSDKVPANENKGLNWMREAVKKNHIGALEYKTYWDIRFDRAPKLDKIVMNLEKIIEINKSPRACNTLAELNHASASGITATSTPEAVEKAKEKKVVAAKHYMMSAQ
jgi:TPR repeat protein